MGHTGGGNLGSIRLLDGDGSERPIADYLGRPLVVVCVRYYG